MSGFDGERGHINLLCGWCGKAGAKPEYCSSRCERAQWLYSMKCLKAMQNDQELPEKEDIDRAIQNSNKWTVDSMRRRVQQLKSLL